MTAGGRTVPTHVPIRSDATSWSYFGPDLIVFNTLSKQYVTLNTTAARIFELSSGERPVDSIADVLVGEYDDDPEVIRSDVQSTVEGMVELGLLELR